ncbi:MAG: ABC transporter permease [Planctomycetota bacterium]
MLRFIAIRVLQFPLILAAIYLITFALAWVAPGDPFSAQTEGNDPQRVQELRERFNVTSSWDFLTTYPVNLLRGEFGPSFSVRDKTVGQIIADTLPVSLAVGGLAIVIATGVGIAIGTLAAVRRDGVLDFVSLSIALIGVSVPSFVVAVTLLSSFAYGLELLPLGGWPPGFSQPDAYLDLDPGLRETVVAEDGQVTYEWNLSFGQQVQLFFAAIPDYLRHMLLPALALSLLPMAYITRLTRVSMIDVLGNDYIRTARAKGVGRLRVIFKHALRNGLLPVLSFLGPATANILVGSFIVETIFKLPGLGTFFINSVTARDQPLILGTVMVYSVLLLSLNLVVDVLYGIVDPRISLTEGGK